jgi:hypothetical protein
VRLCAAAGGFPRPQDTFPWFYFNPPQRSGLPSARKDLLNRLLPLLQISLTSGSRATSRGVRGRVTLAARVSLRLPPGLPTCCARRYLKDQTVSVGVTHRLRRARGVMVRGNPHLCAQDAVSSEPGTTR